jgi:PPOX class probable F420-dependent enzyme
VNVDAAVARARFGEVRVARLATASGSGEPHLVPITFALLDEDTIVTAVDHKPKRTLALKRLDNIARNPHVSVLVDFYDDDWSALWWARADGVARVGEAAVEVDAVRALCERYPQYRETPPGGAVIVVAVERWSGWSAAG